MAATVAGLGLWGFRSKRGGGPAENHVAVSRLVVAPESVAGGLPTAGTGGAIDRVKQTSRHLGRSVAPVGRSFRQAVTLLAMGR